MALTLATFLATGQWGVGNAYAAGKSEISQTGPFAPFTRAEQDEAGVVEVVETGRQRTPRAWTYIAKQAGDYQLGMAWIELIGPGEVTVEVLVDGASVQKVVARQDTPPQRFETRLEGLSRGDRIEIKTSPVDAVVYRMGFHLMLATPSFDGMKIFEVSDFGARADGVHDDFSAIQKAVAAAKRSGGGIVRFEPGMTYRVIGRQDLTYEAVFDLEDTANIKIEGQGSTLILHPPDGLANIHRARNIQIDSLFVDYEPKPYYQGTITGIDVEALTIDIRVPDRYPVPETGETKSSMPFFGRSFIPDHAGARSGRGHNIYVRATTPLDDPRHIRIHLAESASSSDTPNAPMKLRLEEAKAAGATEFVVPHLRYGHNRGHSSITESARVLMSDVHTYVVPFFWMVVKDNIGSVTLQRVHLQMRQPETELLASWRDGLHIKNSRFGVMIDGSKLDGAAMYDDTLAIYSRVHRLLEVNGRQLRLEPAFREQIDLHTWTPGDWVSVWSSDQSMLRGMGRLESVQSVKGKNEFVINLESVPPGINPDDTIINEEVLNRSTVIRNCRTTQVGTEYTSTRLRASDIAFEGNHFEDFSFNVEFSSYWATPRSRGIRVQDCYIGGGQSSVSVNWPIDVRIERTRLDAVMLRLPRNAEGVVLDNVAWINAPAKFLHVGPGSRLRMFKGCTVDGKPIKPNNPGIDSAVQFFPDP